MKYDERAAESVTQRSAKSTDRVTGSASQQVGAPRKSLGQHWLKDKASLDSICDAAGVKPSDTVLEIGPGTGELTDKLLKRGAKVVAVELDERLAAGLQQRFKGLPFSLNMLSILDFDLSSLPGGYKIAANIPYYLTNHLLRMLCETQHKPSVAVLLVQKEVAERVTADPGEMSLLSVSVQLYYEPSLGAVVPANLFEPPPKVDSQILILKQLATTLFPGTVPGNKEDKAFFRVVKAGFSQRRKTLLNSLSAGLHLSKQETEELLKRADINPASRPQELSLKDWHGLYSQSS